MLETLRIAMLFDAVNSCCISRDAYAVMFLVNSAGLLPLNRGPCSPYVHACMQNVSESFR